ncbi:VC0807 family protein [Actinomycetospora aeridis]|uniref:VC0807 family protein n=1 Tax=Actinomycetospora aeridis TaxID=3129231 RepID=A0ABU8N962_9PSEU
MSTPGTAVSAPETPEASTPSESAPPETRGGLGALTGLLFDIGIPVLGYYVLHLLGTSDWVALLVATVAAGLRLCWVAVRTRRITWFAAVMLGMFGLGLALAFASDDPRFMLLSDSFTTSVVALGFLGSLVVGKPLTLSAFQTWKPREAGKMDEYYRTNPVVRRLFRVSALVWGLGLLIESVARIPLVYALPVEVMVGVSAALLIATNAGLAVWNVAYAVRQSRRASAWAGEHVSV